KYTITLVASTSKVPTTLCALMLIDRGILDLNAPVAKYWPEFAQAGKEKLPVRYLLSHTSGLAGIDEPITFKDVTNWNKIARLLAAQKPWWEPGNKSGYHGWTFNYLIGELIRRISGKTLPAFFREEIAIPLNIDFHFGSPDLDIPHFTDLISDPPWNEFYVNIPPELQKQFYWFLKVFGNPKSTPKYGAQSWTTLMTEGCGNARSVAKVGAVFACGGSINDKKVLSLETIEKAIEEQIYKTDLVLMVPMRWGLGVGLDPVDRSWRGCFWGGSGGSSIIMDLDEKMSLAYVMNNMRRQSPEETASNKYASDTRANRLVKAVYESLELV
ncbi:MAG: serine hydrolase domain-containing protein, partial [Promethearchaeota archaeon]